MLYTYYTDEVLTKAFKLAEKNGYLDNVRKIQNQVPKTTCKCCGSCCIDSPDAFFTEFLLFFKEFQNLPKDRAKSILLKVVDWSLFSLFRTKSGCPLLGEDRRCTIYDIRPLNCRVWGFESKEDFDSNYENNVKPKNEEFRQYYKLKYNIDLDEPPKMNYCDSVVQVNKRPFSKNDIDELYKRIGKMDAQFIKKQIINSLCYEALPVHLSVFVQSKCNISADEWALARVEITKELRENNFSKTYENFKQHIINNLNLE